MKQLAAVKLVRGQALVTYRLILLRLGLRFGSASSPADIIIHLVDRTDSVLRTTTIYYRFGKVVRAEVILAKRTAMQLPLDRADVQNIAAHEFGHALGRP